MARNQARPTLGVALYVTLLVCLGAYFTYIAIQGDNGIVRRIQLHDQATELRQELAYLERQVSQMRNKTERLSANYLDLDLLDERARTVLGYARADELIIN